MTQRFERITDLGNKMAFSGPQKQEMPMEKKGN